VFIADATLFQPIQIVLIEAMSEFSAFEFPGYPGIHLLITNNCEPVVLQLVLSIPGLLYVFEARTLTNQNFIHYISLSVDFL